MTELKTVKDLEKQDWSTHKENMGLVRAVFFDLKAEAVKWVKYYRLHGENNKAISLQHFHDITEEDLK